jgi:C4-dicarboxylate-specific signal transduction histidine kinase
MRPFHKLLLRQLRKRHLEVELLSSENEAVRNFLNDINAAYWQNEDDRELLERSMELSSKELIEANQRMEQQRATLVASAKMSTLGEMASGIAHEINTPLAAITTLASQLIELLDDEEIDKSLLKSHARKIEATSFKIGKIISGLRTFSRNANADPFVDIQAKDLLEDVLSLCQERFVLSGVEIRKTLQSEALSFKGRPAQLAQVIVNLLNNAFDAISTLSDRWVDIEVREDTEGVEIVITDSGSGIPPHVQEQMFQPFFTTKEIGKGTGIGLSISRTILQAHHGELVLNSQCKNTQFILKLPKDLKEKEEKAA